MELPIIDPDQKEDEVFLGYAPLQLAETSDWKNFRFGPASPDQLERPEAERVYPAFLTREEVERRITNLPYRTSTDRQARQVFLLKRLLERRSMLPLTGLTRDDIGLILRLKA